VNRRTHRRYPRASYKGRHRRPARTCYPPFAVSFARLLVTRILPTREFRTRPAREITLEARRRERAWREGRDV
jgi:hypothetical protein